jgi:hypothetical protein
MPLLRDNHSVARPDRRGAGAGARGNQKKAGQAGQQDEASSAEVNRGLPGDRLPLRRLGSGQGDLAELERHPFFQLLDFSKVFNREYTPIYKPSLGCVTDVANFDPTFTREHAVDSLVEPSHQAGQPNQFEGFSYRASYGASVRDLLEST